MGGSNSASTEVDKTLVFPYEREGEGDPAGEHDLEDLPEWMEGPEPGEKGEGEEREEIARRDNEELFHDGVGPSGMAREDDSLAIEMPDGFVTAASRGPAARGTKGDPEEAANERPDPPQAFPHDSGTRFFLATADRVG